MQGSLLFNEVIDLVAKLINELVYLEIDLSFQLSDNNTKCKDHHGIGKRVECPEQGQTIHLQTMKLKSHLAVILMFLMIIYVANFVEDDNCKVGWHYAHEN